MKWLLVAALLMGALATWTWAEPPASGVYSNSYAGQLSIWDVTGNYSDSLLGGQLDGDYTLSMDNQGKLAGQGSANFYESGLDIDLDFAIAGAVKKVGDSTDVLFTQNVSGTVDYENKHFKVTGKIKYHLTADPVTRMMSGSISGNICIVGKGCASLKALNYGDPLYFETEIDDFNMDGSWDLILNVENVDGKNLVAQAKVALSNGRSVTLNGAGKYSDKTDTSKIKAKGMTSDTVGSKLSLMATGAGLDIVAGKGKLFGQKTVIPNP